MTSRSRSLLLATCFVSVVLNLFLLISGSGFQQSKGDTTVMAEPSPLPIVFPPTAPPSINNAAVAGDSTPKARITSNTEAWLSPPPAPTLSELALYGIESRISALGKIVGLSDQEKQQLRVKYQSESLARKGGQKVDTESLESIIGEDNAQFFRQRLDAAYEKSRTQAIDREIYYTSRKLNFSTEQESIYRDLLAAVEVQVDQKFAEIKRAPEYQNDASVRVRVSIEENEFRSSWLNQQLKSRLPADQYQAYVQEEADSSAAELGMWHAP